MKNFKSKQHGPQLSNSMQNTPRGGKWAIKFEDNPMREKDDVHAKKSLGQHFLNDLSIAKRIADVVDEKMDGVLEIGPGMGIMTKFLYSRFGERLLCAEIDKNSVVYLGKQAWAKDLRIWQGDFLKATESEWLMTEGLQAIIGNFPYNISTQIVFKMLEAPVRVKQFSGMFQKEVGERLCAAEGNKDYGVTSVLLQAYYDCKYLFTVGEKSFNPPPRVKGGVIDCKLRSEMPNCDNDALKLVVKTAFSQRRKTLGNAMKALTSSRVGFLLPDGWAALRAEQISVNDYIYLAKLWVDSK